MIIKQRKSIFILIIVMLMFLAAAIFISVNFQSPKANAAGENVEYTIQVEGDGKVIASGGAEISFTEGTQTFSSAIENEIIFNAEKYYQFSSATVEWTGGDISVNGAKRTLASDMPCTINDITDLSVQALGTAVDRITITFTLEKITYSIRTINKYIENYVLNDENTDAGGLIELSKDTVQLDDDVYISMPDEGENQKFYDYALWNKKGNQAEPWKNYEYQGLSKNPSNPIKIDSVFLDKYLLDNEIIIVGAFIKTFTVSIFDYENDAYSGNFIEVTITNVLTGNKTITNYDGSPIAVDEGSRITVTAKDIPHFKFDKFIVKEGGNPEEDSVSAKHSIDYLNANYVITAEFSKKEYSLKVVGQDSLGKEVLLTGGGGFDVTGLTNDKFSIGDTIKIELTNTLLEELVGQHLYDNRFSIKVGTLYSFIWLSNVGETEVTATESIAEIKITAEFLDKYLNLNSETINIFANFSVRYTFSIVLDDATGLGSKYAISIKDDNNNVLHEEILSGNYTPSNPFNYGTVITIVLNPAKYATYNLGNVYTTSELSDDTITIELNYENRDITIRFVHAQFNIQDTTEFEDYVISSNNDSRSLEGLSIGSVITISVGVADNDEIKKWILKGNGRDFDVLKGDLSDYGAEYKNGSLRVVLTKEWLDEFGYIINSDVLTGFKTSLLVAIILPSVAVPILAVILIIIFITNAKRKKFIKAELLEEKMAGYNYGAGSMVEDLKNDTFNKVSDDEVKAELKKRKDKKK